MLHPNRLQNLTWLVAPLAVFGAVLATMGILNRSAPPSVGAAQPDGGPAAPTADTAAVIAELREASLADPSNADAAAALGDAYYQRLRETGDGGLASRAERAYRRALAAEPGNVSALAGRATIALNAHRFADGLELARRAHRAEPQLVAPYASLVDGLIETGRYDAAGRALDRMLALKPTQAAYLRASYFSELHGDLRGAEGALDLALSAGAGTVESAAYVRWLTGNFEAARGNYSAAEAAYREALAVSPGYSPAARGLALLDAGKGRYDAAIRTLRAELTTPPSPDALTELGEVEQAAGLMAAAQRHYERASALEARGLKRGAGYDAGVTLNEAEHGDPATAVEYGRRAWRSAPSVSSADGYAWALHQAGRFEAAARLSEEAMRLGSRDPGFLYRAGMIARANGDEARAERLLAALLDQAPRFNALYAPEARRALTQLHGATP